jgi:hypothetical protein
VHVHDFVQSLNRQSRIYTVNDVHIPSIVGTVQAMKCQNTGEYNGSNSSFMDKRYENHVSGKIFKMRTQSTKAANARSEHLD